MGDGIFVEMTESELKRDLEEGRLTLEKAADLIGDVLLYSARLLWLKGLIWRDHTQKGKMTSIALGGPDQEGKDISTKVQMNVPQYVRL